MPENVFSYKNDDFKKPICMQCLILKEPKQHNKRRFYIKISNLIGRVTIGICLIPLVVHL